MLGRLLEVCALLWRVALVIESVETSHDNSDRLGHIIQKVDRVADGDGLRGHLAVGDVRGLRVDQDGVLLDVTTAATTCLM